IVILPDHLHCVWQLPADDGDYPLRWNLIKGTFARQLPATESIQLSRHLKRERDIWQRGYCEHLIRDQDDLQRHLDYIHYNPVKHGHVRNACDWPYSSIHRSVSQVMIEPDWARASAKSDP